MDHRKYTTLPYTEYPVDYGHFDTNRIYPIDKIVLHSSASTKQGLIDTFGGGTRMVSAHYGIDNQGNLMSFLEEYNVAYHAGNYRVNQSSIGIEHVDEGPTVKLHTNEQYDTSIKLVADICKYYGIPCDIEHVVPHSAIIPTACPNGLDISRIIDGANILLNPPQAVSTPQPVPPVESPVLSPEIPQSIPDQIPVSDNTSQPITLENTPSSLPAKSIFTEVIVSILRWILALK